MRTLSLPFRSVRLPSPPIFKMGVSFAVRANITTRRGESGAIYSFIQPLGKDARSRSNVWLVEEEGKSNDELIAKGPSAEDDKSLGWPAFQHELRMQRLFSKDKMIRPIVDFIPSSTTDEPMMVLKPFEQTLWDARNARPMTTSEIKWIMEGVLLGLQTVHQRRLVYTDLKMENIGITGFDNDKPNENIREIIVRIADCGSISEPGRREISSLTYRSPEVYFGKSWNQSTDIWSWGIILAQLLLAQVDFTSPGMYDTISTGTLEALYAGEEDSASLLPPERPGPDGIYGWAVDMSEKGIAGEDLQFLVDVLNPRPDVRPTAAEIMSGGYLKVLLPPK
ncbi:kinase-like domain-containing protein [Xylaria acuta]|nr:kinase-like domain-containing protein [Xylaria acuta]